MKYEHKKTFIGIIIKNYLQEYQRHRILQCGLLCFEAVLKLWINLAKTEIDNCKGRGKGWILPRGCPSKLRMLRMYSRDLRRGSPIK